tara:strand:- start:1452 stop:3347 length:1896 start_codon:yes stop_codon:yes gene_type:complete
MADKSILGRLQRLFSTDVIIRNVGGNQLKVADVNQIQMSGELQNNSFQERYSSIHSSNPTSMHGQQASYNYQQMRPQLYSEFDVMDTDAIIASTLDILSEESTLKNDMGEVLHIKSADENIQKILYNLFYDVLNIEFNLSWWIRNACKYGDFFLKLEISEKYGVYNVIPFNAYSIERQDGFDKENPMSTRYKYLPNGVTNGSNGYFATAGTDDPQAVYFDNYEMAHFRLLSDVNYLPYGRSYLEPARKLFKQYTMMEDAMLVHRIVRAPEKRIFYMNVGGIAPAEVENFIQKAISKIKKTPHMDPKTGEYNLKYNMQNMMEDFYIPMRNGDSTTKIDTLGGMQYDGIKDVEYLRDKLFAALRVPKAFLGYDESLSGKAVLAAEDIRFARTVEKIQRIMVSELYKIAFVHLYSQGYTQEQLVNFELSLTTPSIIYDQEKVALLKEKVDLMQSMADSKLFSSDWIYENVFHMSVEEYEEMRELAVEDAKRNFRIAQVENEGNDPNTSGQSFGTPHDIATAYGKGRVYDRPGSVPTGYNEDEPVMGRPKEKASNTNTQDDNFGKDRLGKDAMKNDSQEGYGRDKTKPFAFEGTKREFAKHMKAMDSLTDKKVNLFEDGTQEGGLLDESQLREEK